MASLDALLTAESKGDGVFVTTLPDGWHQGRPLYGGLVTGLMTRQMERVVPGRPLRSLTAELFAPALPGEATLKVTVLREGNAVTTVTALLSQNSLPVAHGVGVLGKQRVADREITQLTPPTPPAWESVEPLPYENGFFPEFAQNFEYRLTGLAPFIGAPEGQVEAWIRPREASTLRDSAFFACCVDSAWPTLFSREEGPRPMATIAFTFQPFLANLEGVDPNAPWFQRSRLAAATDGYVVEFREMWSHTGKLLALNQQTFVIIK
jgi:hypothetical protein